MEQGYENIALLKQIEESSSEIFENAPCGYLFSNLDGIIIKINKTLSKITGFNPDETLNKKRFRDILTIGSKIYYETNFDPLLRLQGFLNEVALDILTKERKIVPALVNSVAIKNDKNETLGYQTTFFNISDRRAYERELLSSKMKSEESELRLRFLANAGKLLQSNHGNITGFKDLTQIAVEHFCDACCIDLLKDGKTNRVAEAYRGQGKVIPSISDTVASATLSVVTRISDLNASSLEETLRLLPWIESFKDFLPESIITTPIILFGRSVGVISFLMLELGRKFKAADEELTVEVARRLSLAIETSQLESEKTETLRNLKEERDVREKFVATLTHDLRSPITAIKMSAQLISRKAEKDDIKQLASRVIKGVDRADSMIQDLLDANSLRAGQPIPLEFSKVDVTSEVAETVSELNVAHGNRLILSSKDSIVTTASTTGIKRVLENLCNNAIKYGAPDSPIEVSLEEMSSSIIISVHNFGNPISEGDQVSIFDVYKRTDSATTGGQKGWGLGLALVRGVVEAHGGTVSVSSALSSGTIFRVSIPKR